MIAKFKKIEKWQRKKRNFFSITFLIFIGVGILFSIVLLTISNLKINRERAQLDSKINSLKEEIKEFQKKETFLQSQISRTREEEEEYSERVARDDFNLKKEGEKAVAVIFESDKEEPDQNNNTFSEKGSIWQKIFQGIRNFFLR